MYAMGRRREKNEIIMDTSRAREIEPWMIGMICDGLSEMGIASASAVADAQCVK